jgi:hypothetical protein
MALELEQEELLSWMVESSRDTPRAERIWFFHVPDGPASLHGPGGVKDQLLETDMYALAQAGLVRPGHSGKDYTLTGDGYAYYSALKQREGEPVARQETNLRSLIEAGAFRRDSPMAYARWAEAEALLWTADSRREFTTIGHKAREAIQEFATELIAKYQPPNADPDPALVNRRLGAVIAAQLPELGEARAAHLRALGDYSEATLGLIQRQEHGGQKEGHALTWQDARRVVLHSAVVMCEFTVSLSNER